MTQRDKRTLLIGTGITVALLIGFFLYMQASGGGEVALPSVPPLPTETGTPSPGPGESPSVSVSPTTVPPVINPTGRDPFAIPAVFVTSSAAPTSGSTTPPSTPPSSTPPTQPGGDGTGGGGGGTGGGGTGGSGDTLAIGGHSVTLIDTFTRQGTQRAQVEVDGVIHDVAEGGTFTAGGDTFELTNVEGSCARFLLGDQAFTLCVTPRK